MSAPVRTDVLVLGGGPDREREVSIESSLAVATALRESGRCDVRYEVIDRLDEAGLRAMLSGSEGEVVFPVLHGPWGEGGGVQRLLESVGVPFVGCGSRSAAASMDKVRTKQAALGAGVRVLETAIVDPAVSEEPPFELPVIVKPVCQGSSIGLRVCRDVASWREAVDAVGDMPMMAEPMIEPMREIAVGLVAEERGVLAPVPIVEIAPSAAGGGLYDYEAKYERDDTVYTVGPELPDGVGERGVAWTRSVAHALGVRHLCRADFLLDDGGGLWFLELNTMPGFTSHSLLPRACAHAGIGMASLCAGLVERAWADARTGAVM